MTFTSASKVGRSTDVPTSACAARWRTTSGRISSKSRVERLADVVLVQRRRRVQVLAAAGREVVDDVHLVPARDERVDDVRADEARSSGDDRPHGRILARDVRDLRGNGRLRQDDAGGAPAGRRSQADGREVVTAREPGGTALGEADPRASSCTAAPMTPWAEALLYAASRAELVAEVIRPALERGADVLFDRYLDSVARLPGHRAAGSASTRCSS